VAEESGSKIVITEDPLEAAKDADICIPTLSSAWVKTRLVKEIKGLDCLSVG